MKRRKDAPSSGVRLGQGGNMAAERPSAILRLAAMQKLNAPANSASGAGSRKDVDSFLKTYEAFVVEYEKAAESNDMTAMMNAAVKANELAEKQKTLESSQHWTQKDAQKILALAARLSAAMQKLNASAGAAPSF